MAKTCWEKNNTFLHLKSCIYLQKTTITYIYTNNNTYNTNHTYATNTT